MNQINQDLKDLIEFHTVFENKTQINKCLNFLEQKFSKDFIIKKYNFKERKCLVLSNTKSKNLDIIFAGHVDVVPAPKEKFKAKIKGDMLFARGAYDMKGPLIATIYGVKKFLKSMQKLKVAIFITSDEEIDGQSTKYLIEKQKYKSKFAIIPDGGSEQEIVINQKGFWQFELEIKGKSAHASKPWEGINPILEANNLINKFSMTFPAPKHTSDWKTSVTATKIVVGKSINQIPPKANIFFDVRYISTKDIQLIKQTIKNVLGGKYNLNTLAMDNPIKTDKNNKYLQKMIKVIKKVNKHKVRFIKSCSTSDAVFFHDKQIPVVLFRPLGGGMHRDNEFINLKSLIDFKKIIYNFLLKISS